MFGILGALSGPVSIRMAVLPSVAEIVTRIPLVLVWIWINLLPLDINNQRHPDAIEEDSVNKPWRPLPSKRCTPRQATCIMLMSYALALLVSYFNGNLKQSITLIILGCWYNNFGGADKGYLIRNLLNGCGYLCFAAGALIITSRSASMTNLTTEAFEWLFILGAVVFSTIQLQDLYDQAGDSLRGRRTMPLIIGDSPTRWILAFGVIFWSVLCPRFWVLSWPCYLPTAVTSIAVAYRVLTKRSVLEDRITFRIWNVWVVGLYALPLIKRFNAIH